MIIEERKEVQSIHWAPTGAAIYYFLSSGDTSDLMKVSVVGKTNKPVTLADGLETSGVFAVSADGTQLSYARTRSSSNLWAIDLTTRDSDNSHVKKTLLTSGTPNYEDPEISPDGGWLAYTNGSGTSRNVYKMQIDGGPEFQLTFFDSANTFSPAWSPDGRQIAFISDQGGRSRVWLTNANGGEVHALDKTDSSGGNNLLNWFPSRQIIYQKPGLHNLLEVDPQSLTQKSVLPADSPGWIPGRPKPSPDGGQIAVFWSHEPGGLWIIKQAPYAETFVTEGMYFPIGWSSDGNIVYAIHDTNRPELFKISLRAPHTPKEFIKMPAAISGGAVAPDGRKIVVDQVERKSDIWTMSNFDPQ